MLRIISCDLDLGWDALSVCAALSLLGTLSVRVYSVLPQADVKLMKGEGRA